MAKDIKITFRLTEELNAKIEKDAQAKDRSASYIICEILEQYYKISKKVKK